MNFTTKYRCANSRIPVYNQIYMYETELCTLCDLNLNGDEYHCIMIYPYFRQSRELYLKHYFYTMPNMLKFDQLLSSENKRTFSRLAEIYYMLIIISMIGADVMLMVSGGSLPVRGSGMLTWRYRGDLCGCGQVESEEHLLFE